MAQSFQRESRVALVALSMSAFLLLGATACSKKNAAKCEEATGAVRQSLKVENWALAGQWRERAYTYCEDQGQLAALDREIPTAQSAVQARKAAAEAEQRRQDQVVELFAQWAGSAATNPVSASSKVQCDGGPDAPAAKTQERFCERTRNVAGAEAFVVRHWEKEPTAARFVFSPPGPVTCKDLGGTEKSQWQIPATSGGVSATRALCDLSGPLAGWQALVTGANQAKQYVFSAAYLTRDAGFAQKLRGQ
jgi:hypothetical protein